MGNVRFLTVAAVGILMVGAAVVGVETRQARQRASPHESVSATIDGSAMTITYGRPSTRGRMIFGRLVPWDRVWCPGADEATTLDSARPLRIGGLTVPPGPHTIWILPTPDAWTLVVSRESSGFHTNYNSSADLGRVEMIKRTVADPVEQLTFAIVKNAAGGGGAITMTWETTEASVPFAVE
ncbi:MAG: DUF2911 domain-containing protein [Acidobacteriota bacterium]